MFSKPFMTEKHFEKVFNHSSHTCSIYSTTKEKVLHYYKYIYLICKDRDDDMNCSNDFKENSSSYRNLSKTIAFVQTIYFTSSRPKNYVLRFLYQNFTLLYYCEKPHNARNLNKNLAFCWCPQFGSWNFALAR